MNKDKALAGMDRLTAELLTPAFYEKRFDLGVRMPSLPVLEELMQRLRAVSGT